MAEIVYPSEPRSISEVIDVKARRQKNEEEKAVRITRPEEDASVDEVIGVTDLMEVLE